MNNGDIMETVVKRVTLKRMVQEKNMRISADALDKLTEVIDNYTEEIIELITNVAKHAKRKTVKGADVEYVINMNEEDNTEVISYGNQDSTNSR